MKKLCGPTIVILLLLGLISFCYGNYPLLDVDTNMRIVLIPHDAPVGSIIYRLRASDSDNNFPLVFEVLGSLGKALLSLVDLGCSEAESLCQADVVLTKALDLGRTYEFQLRVTDTAGDFTRVKAAITATEGTVGQSMFGPKILRIPENAALGAELSSFIVLKNELNSRTVLLEMRESKERIELKQRLLSNNRTEGTLHLKKYLDFESEPWFTFQLLAMNGHTNTSVDTRNVLVADVIVAVEDVQDTPPQFTFIPSFVELPSTLTQGTVVARVKAVDGDRENKRLISYGFLTESNPFVAFFDLHSMSGEIRLKRNASELLAIAKPNEAIHLSVLAQEIVPSGQTRSINDGMAVANISFWLDNRVARGPPQFSSDKYTGEIRENSLVGTAVIFQHKNSVWVENSDESLELHLMSVGGAGNAFDVSPHEGRGNITFDILVKDSSLLDFEVSQLVKLKLKASIASGLSKEVYIDINVRDENDNAPIWSEKEYHVDITENTPAGTTVLRVHASDKDSGNSGQIVYSSVVGSDAFHVDPLSGDIVVDKPSLLDRELQSEIRLYIEARDGGYNVDSSDSHSVRNLATAMVVIKVLDKNDQSPVFDKAVYQAILTPDLDALKWPLQVKAHDLDEEGHPNSQLKYQIVGDAHFTIDTHSGDIRLRSPFVFSNRDTENPFLGSFKVKAFDLGSPQLSTETTVQIFSEDVMSQDIQFLFPSSADLINKDRLKIEQMLSALTGGHVSILEITPYDSRSPPHALPQSQKSSRTLWPQAKSVANQNHNNADVTSSPSSDQSVVHATVQSPLSGRPRVVDLAGLKAFMTSESINVTPSPSKEIEVSKAESRSLFWILIALIIFLVLLFIIFLCCIFCPCCWLHRHGSARKSEKLIERSEIKESDRFLGRSRRTVPVDTVQIEQDQNYRTREAWSGDENHQWRPQVYPPSTRRKPRNIQNLQHRNDVAMEEWEFAEHGMPPQGRRSDLRSEEIVPRWQFMQQNQSHPQQQRRHVGYIGNAHPGDEEFVRRQPDQEQYERDSNPARNNFGYLTSEMDNRDQRVQRVQSQRSPSRSLPPATTDFRVQVEPKQPHTRFFRTEMGEVLQFDFDGDEGKEMLMRRFIDEQKPQASAREDQVLSNAKENRLYGRRPDTPTETNQRRRIRDGQQPGNDISSAAPATAVAYHSEQEVTSERPKAASISRRQNLPRERQEIPFDREIPELEEEIEEIIIPGAVRQSNKSRKMDLQESESSAAVQSSVRRHRRKDKHDKTILKHLEYHRSSSQGSDESFPKLKSKSPSKSPAKMRSPRRQRSESQSQSRSHSPPAKSSKPQTIAASKEKREPSQPTFGEERQNILERESTSGFLGDGTNIGISVLSPNSAKSGDSHVNQRKKQKSLMKDQTGSKLQVQNERSESSLMIREEDDDSGIGLVGVANKRSKMLEKKSVFTIAYDDMASQNVLRPDTALNTDVELHRV